MKLQATTSFKTVALCLLSLLLTLNLAANMRSPIQSGHIIANPFFSNDIDIIKENLLIVIDKDFKFADFTAHYNIKADAQNPRLPLIFFAINRYTHGLDDSFDIEVNGQKIYTSKLNLVSNKESILEQFNIEFNVPKGFHQEVGPRIHFLWDYYTPSKEDLIYFEIPIKKGENDIVIHYKAYRWFNELEIKNRYGFTYALEPAKHWRSFGELNIKLDASRFPETLVTNLGPPNKGDINQVAEWTFDSIPSDFIAIEFNPELSQKAKLMNEYKSDLIKLLFVMGFVLHFVFILLRNKKEGNTKRTFTILYKLMFFLPLILLMTYFVYNNLLKQEIGVHYSQLHQSKSVYLAFLFVLFPVFWIVYGLVVVGINYLVSKILKK